ncbi:MAG TPA: type II toxin-antitoxin system VapC family toxin [Thermoanaerobaculia bacterium]|nr:type II toxin-antitoxin system VapC family toxin [Thermoanaerobaculia bacterium]
MIFIDSNIPMYLVGAAHPNKVEAQRLLEKIIQTKEHLVTDAEVLQEVLHRYSTSAHRDAIQPAFDSLLGIVDEIFPVELRDVQRAKEILLSTDGISARDALHLATMERHGVKRILSFDGGFLGIPGVMRLPSPSQSSV